MIIDARGDRQQYIQAAERGAHPLDAGNYIRFVNSDHRDFYSKQVQTLKPDIYLKALIYTLGICSDTRRRFDSIYDAENRCINPAAIRAVWQTGTSLKVCRLAFNLFNGGVPTVSYVDATDNGELNECRRYSASDIFCCVFAPYFFEAIKIRYPEYMARCW